MGYTDSQFEEMERNGDFDKQYNTDRQQHSFAVACWDKSGGEPAFNALRFTTEEEAEHYGADLYSRWTGLDRYEVQRKEEPPNYYETADGKFERIQGGEDERQDSQQS